MRVKLLEELHECRIGHLGPVYVTIWFNELSMHALDRLDYHFQELARRYGMVTFISVAAAATSMPSAEIRARLKKDTPAAAKLRRANIIVVTAKGLGAIITRSFLAAMNLMNEEKQEIVTTLEDAAKIARELPGQDAATRDDAGLATALAEFAKLPRPVA